MGFMSKNSTWILKVNKNKNYICSNCFLYRILSKKNYLEKIFFFTESDLKDHSFNSISIINMQLIF